MASTSIADQVTSPDLAERLLAADQVDERVDLQRLLASDEEMIVRRRLAATPGLNLDVWKGQLLEDKHVSVRSAALWNQAVRYRLADMASDIFDALEGLRGHSEGERSAHTVSKFR